VVGGNLGPPGDPFPQRLGGAHQEVQDISSLVGGGAIVERPVPSNRGTGPVGEGPFPDLGDVLLEEVAGDLGMEHDGGGARPVKG
jgi:hypothetical protein